MEGVSEKCELCNYNIKGELALLKHNQKKRGNKTRRSLNVMNVLFMEFIFTKHKGQFTINCTGMCCAIHMRSECSVI